MTEGFLLLVEIVLFAALLLAVRRASQGPRLTNLGIFSYRSSEDEASDVKVAKGVNKRA
jgi:hypothetical protein